MSTTGFRVNHSAQIREVFKSSNTSICIGRNLCSQAKQKFSEAEIIAALKRSEAVLARLTNTQELFTVKYLGYDVVMYDGSFFEWSNAEGAPVVSGRERQ